MLFATESHQGPVEKWLIPQLGRAVRWSMRLVLMPESKKGFKEMMGHIVKMQATA